jgi:hypothetical protein
MANLKTLKPFQKGHKKLGGRTKGVPNKNSQYLPKLFMAAAARLGSDGQGTDGAVGFFVSLLQNPRTSARFLLAILRYEEKHPPEDLAQQELRRFLQSAVLNQEERKMLERIWEKVTGTKLLDVGLRAPPF